VVTWRVLDQAAHANTIPESFDGTWQSTRPDRTVFTATLGTELQKGELASGGTWCTSGTLTVSDATDSG
jgi:hypothetical protein